MKRYWVEMNTFEDGLHEEVATDGKWVKYTDVDAEREAERKRTDALLAQCEEALRTACGRFDLITTARARGFAMAYCEGCAQAGCDEIDSALAAIRAAREDSHDKG